MTPLRRRIRFPGRKFTYKAGSLLFQGAAADCLKVNLVAVDEYFRHSNGHGQMILNVQDEFDSSVPKHKVKKVDKDIAAIIEDFDSETAPFKFRVPIRSESGQGPNWWEASK